MSSSTPPLGAHVSVAGGLWRAFERAAELDCGAIQIFVKNANRWQGSQLTGEEVERFRHAHEASAVGALVAHASYLINLAAADPVLAERSRLALADELERCSRLGVSFLVVHPGAHGGAGEEAGIERAAASVAAVLAASPATDSTREDRRGLRLLLENTAGQGSGLGYRLEQLARMRLLAGSPERVGVCIDTCHAFAAGYALDEPAGWDEFAAELAELFPAPPGTAAAEAPVACIHLNDSLRPRGSRRDRHAHIGEGEMGLESFARVLSAPALARTPMILETEPGDEMAGHRRDLAVLRGLLKSPAASSRGRASSGRKRSPRPSGRE